MKELMAAYTPWIDLFLNKHIEFPVRQIVFQPVGNKLAGDIPL